MGNVTTIGLDLAKSVFQVHGVDEFGSAVLRQRLTRARLLKFFAKLPPCRVGMEACASSHFWARELIALGHEVKLMPAQYVKPYVKRGKNDAADAEAICEAVTRPTMRFVGIKTPEQQSAMMLHRVRYGSFGPALTSVSDSKAPMLFGLRVRTRMSPLTRKSSTSA